MIQLLAHGQAVGSFGELVKQLGDNAFASPTRSTVPLLDYWRGPAPRLRDLWERLGVSHLDDAELYFEYNVPVRQGRGKPSYTDLMVLARGVAVAIEAKFTEPRYESVGAWLRRSTSTNRSQVLDGWLEAIEAVLEARIPRDSVVDLPYQLVHRTASVCCADRPRRFVVYQVFGEMVGRHYSDDLRRFASLIGEQDRITFVTLGCGFHPTEAYAQLVALWNSGRRDLARDVRDRLIAQPLLDFHQPVTISIHPTANRAADSPSAPYERGSCGLSESSESASLGKPRRSR